MPAQPPSLSPGSSFGRRPRLLLRPPDRRPVDRVDGRALVLAVLHADPDDRLTNWVLVVQDGRMGWTLPWHL